MAKTTHTVFHSNGIEEVGSREEAEKHGTVDGQLNVYLVGGDVHRYYGANVRRPRAKVTGAGALEIAGESGSFRLYGPAAWSWTDDVAHDEGPDIW